MSYVMSEGGSAVKMTPELTEKVANAPSGEAIKKLLHDAALEQGLIAKDPFDERGDNYYGYQPVEQPIPKGFAKTLVVGDKKYVLESATEDGLVQEELKVMRQIFAPASAQPEVRRDAAGRFLSAEANTAAALLDAARADAAARDAARADAASVDPAADAEAEIVRKALETQGVSIAELRQYTQEKQAENYSSAWQKAGQEFAASPAGHDWAGGDNFQVMLDIIRANPQLLDKPSADTIAHVWEYMKKNDLVVENQEDVEARELSEARTPEDLAAVLRSRNRIQPLGTNLWGR